MNHKRIDPESLPGLDALLELAPGGLNAITNIVERRAALTRIFDVMTAEMPPNETVVTEDRVIPGPEGAPDIAVRTFRPAAADGVLPGIYFIHGGGMVMGDIDGEALVSAMLSETINAVVVSVE